MHHNGTLVHKMFDAINRHDVNEILNCMDRNVEWVAGEQSYHGTDEFRKFVDFWFTGFPDVKCEIKNLVCTDEWCTVEFTGTGTNNGPLSLPTGQISPTGRHVEMPFCEVYRFSNGKIVLGHTYFDMYSMLNQLGLLPKTRQAGA